MKNLFLLLIFVCGFMSCGRSTSNSSEVYSEGNLAGEQLIFFQNLASLSGNTFYGEQTYTADNRESWEGKELVISVSEVSRDEIRLPLHVGEDQSRTFIFLNEDGKLRFRHDHRHEDGTPEDITLYGGYADEKGSGYIQKFPSDQYTDDLLGDNVEREWVVILAEDMSTLKYQLHYAGSLVFESTFNLDN